MPWSRTNRLTASFPCPLVASSSAFLRAVADQFLAEALVHHLDLRLPGQLHRLTAGIAGRILDQDVARQHRPEPPLAGDRREDLLDFDEVVAEDGQHRLADLPFL